LNLNHEGFNERLQEACQVKLTGLVLDRTYSELWTMLIDARNALQTQGASKIKAKEYVKAYDHNKTYEE
jgi:hypothetical protein